MLYTALLLLTVFAVCADAATTLYLLRRPNMRESNPVLRWCIGKVGLFPAVVGTHVFVLLIAAAVRMPWYVLLLVAAAYTWATVNNALIIWRSRKVQKAFRF